ncbi:hypothetical protein PV08_09494 [Exophiala spinifera]|uniref:2,4-dienoyl-CoA reductase [(3E)-enoyl-CoA-producing] n=1 Tax=Exophiala spinifera TaxID=91928 RepID=A0A0D2AZQ9_9EURO|nr:uncharacterized protein PV08_09494 [Exophiala spinifera]KIW12218.1 hypothetical protein PV08_09494 [Exophiala spinifera]
MGHGRSDSPHLPGSAQQHQDDAKSGIAIVISSSISKGLLNLTLDSDSASRHRLSDHLCELDRLPHARVARADACAAKAGVNAISDVSSLENGAQGVTSILIVPGAIAGTEGTDRLVAIYARKESWRNIPQQRFGLVREIADATVFLFGDTAQFINGICLDVDGRTWRLKAGGQFGQNLARVCTSGREAGS